MTGGHRLFFRLALFTLQAVEQGSELFNFAPEREDPHLFSPQSLFQLCQHAQHVAQLTLH